MHLLSTYYIFNVLSTFCRVLCGRSDCCPHFTGGKADVARSLRDPTRAKQLISGALDIDIFLLKTEFTTAKYM